MKTRLVSGRIGCGLVLLLAVALPLQNGHATSAAANECAAKLPKDAKAIFDATLPKVVPGANLRDLVTTNTRSLAIAGTIDRGTARQSAAAAGQCLQLAGT